MANRVMAQKTMKMKRMRRAYAKTFTPRNYLVPNRDMIKALKDSANGLVDTAFVDTVGIELKLHEEKLRHLRKQATLENWLPKDCILKTLGPGPRTPFQESWTYCNSRKDCFVVIHLDKHNGIERRSTNYSSKELLNMCWDGDAIQWVYKAAIAAT